MGTEEIDNVEARIKPVKKVFVEEKDEVIEAFDTFIEFLEGQRVSPKVIIRIREALMWHNR